MKVIGITGGVGSGKSAVLKLLEEEYHAVVVQLDEVAKALQRKGTPCWKAIVEAFGREILDENEELDRKKIWPKLCFRAVKSWNSSMGSSILR